MGRLQKLLSGQGVAVETPPEEIQVTELVVSEPEPVGVAVPEPQPEPVSVEPVIDPKRFAEAISAANNLRDRLAASEKLVDQLRREKTMLEEKVRIAVVLPENVSEGDINDLSEIKQKLGETWLKDALFRSTDGKPWLEVVDDLARRVQKAETLLGTVSRIDPGFLGARVPSELMNSITIFVHPQPPESEDLEREDQSPLSVAQVLREADDQVGEFLKEDD